MTRPPSLRAEATAFGPERRSGRTAVSAALFEKSDEAVVLSVRLDRVGRRPALGIPTTLSLRPEELEPLGEAIRDALAQYRRAR